MKKILMVLSSLILIFGLIGCGSHKKKIIPNRATVDVNGGYGMQYHVAIYMLEYPGGQPYYVRVNIYMDYLGTVKGNDILWKNYNGDDSALEEGGEDLSNVRVIINEDIVEVQGFVQEGYADINGKYTIETSSPDSWGVPYD